MLLFLTNTILPPPPPPPPPPLHQLIHSMLMPSVEMRDTESNLFQINFIKCGGINLIFDILTSNDFLSHGDNNLTRYMNVYMHVYMYVILRMYMYVCVYMSVYMYTHTCMYMSVCTCMYAHVCTYMMYVCMYVCMYMKIHVSSMLAKGANKHTHNKQTSSYNGFIKH